MILRRLGHWASRASPKLIVSTCDCCSLRGAVFLPQAAKGWHIQFNLIVIEQKLVVVESWQTQPRYRKCKPLISAFIDRDMGTPSKTVILIPEWRLRRERRLQHQFDLLLLEENNTEAGRTENEQRRGSGWMDALRPYFLKSGKWQIICQQIVYVIAF